MNQEHMKKKLGCRTIQYSTLALFITAIFLFVLSGCKGTAEKAGSSPENENTGVTENSSVKNTDGTGKTAASEKFPVYGHWKSFTSKDGLPSDKTYTVRIDGDRVLVGTHDGLAVYENGKWRTYTTKDGLAHNGVVSIDVSEYNGDVWIGTLSGLTCWSSGKFTNYSQFNSGLPNDLVYCVYCDGKDVWVATGGGAGRYNTVTGKWDIFTEMNAPMHEPWTYGVSASDEKVYIAAWGGGVIEYNKKTKQFRDYTDPDGEMEIDLLPNDGLVHDITTATTYSDGILWVSTYFGLSRYDGKNWKGYFKTDSGLASNFINFVRAEGSVVYICSDNGLSTTDGTTWVTYKKFDNSQNGEAIMTTNTDKKQIAMNPSIAHNFIIGVDEEDGVLWVATSKGVSRGELLN